MKNMTRADIMARCPEALEEWIKDILDEMETRVNSAKRLLEEIKGASSLCNVEECLKELEQFSRDLY